MSRVGKVPVPVPADVQVTLAGRRIAVKGKLGELGLDIDDSVAIEHKEGALWVAPRSDERHARAMWGTVRALVKNLVTGVTQGFTRRLEINGVGYRAAVDGAMLNLQLGFSHDVRCPIPAGLSVKCERPTLIEITGIDRHKVGQFAAEIRGFRPPEPYKGKGIRYENEFVRRKEGKKK